MKLLKENEIKSPYDLREMIWYIIPGVTLLLLIFLFEYWFAIRIRNVFDVPSEKITQTEILNFSVKDSTNNEKYKIILNTPSLEKNSDSSLQVQNESIAYIKAFQDSLHRQELKAHEDSVIMIRQRLKENIHTPVFSVLLFTRTGEKMFGDNWVLSAMYLLLLISICYIVGHTVYILGTFIYERGLVYKGYSYPYVSLLKLDERAENPLANFEVEASQRFYRGIYFWVGCIFILSYIIFKYYGYKYENYPIYEYGICIAVIILLLIPVRLKFILQKIYYWKVNNGNTTQGRPRRSGLLYWFIYTGLLVLLMRLLDFQIKHWPEWIQSVFYDASYTGYFFILWGYLITLFVGLELFFRLIVVRKTTFPELLTRCLRGFTHFRNVNHDLDNKHDREKATYEIIFAAFYNFFGNEIDKFTKNYFHTQDNFDQDFINKYGENFKSVYGLKHTELVRHNYWLPKFFVIENSTHLNQQITFWENTSRFSKSLATSFLLAFIYCSVSFMKQFGQLKEDLGSFANLPTIEYSINILFYIPIVYYIITALSVMYYLYVYDNRYNRMVLRSFVALVSAKEFFHSFEKENLAAANSASGRSTMTEQHQKQEVKHEGKESGEEKKPAV